MDVLYHIIAIIDFNFGSLATAIQRDVIETADLLTKESSYFEELFQLFVSIGMGICLIYFLIDLVNTATTTELTVDKVVKSMMKLLISILIVKEGYQILTLIANIGAKLAEGVTFNEVEFVKLKDIEGNLPIWTLLSAIASMLPGFVITLFVTLYSKIILYSRMIELGIQIVLSPIALADFMNGGLKSSGATFLRKFFALALQGLIIVLILIVFSEISEKMEMNSIIVQVLNALGGSSISFDTGVAAGSMIGVYNSLLSGLATSVTGTTFAAVFIYTFVVYITQGWILMSFIGKSKQIAMDIVGMG